MLPNIQPNREQEGAGMKNCFSWETRGIFGRVLFSVMALVVLPSCELFFASSFDRKAFDRERQLWLDQGIQNYSFYQAYGSESARDSSTVYVQNGIAAYLRLSSGSLVRVDTYGKPGGFIDEPLRFSVSEIYTQIEKLANKDIYKIEVHYNSVLHYPTYVYYEPSDGNYFMIERLDNFVIEPEIPGA